MPVTLTLQNQHVSILQIADELNMNLISLRQQPTNELFQKRCLSLANSLFGKLLIHLSMEDKVLYPNAINSKNSKLSTKALQLMKEIGDLKLKFSAYKEKILSKGIIENTDSFLKETKALLSALKNRVEREEVELYPLFSQEESLITTLKEVTETDINELNF